MNKFYIIPVNLQLATIIAGWIYDEPFSIYSFDSSQETINELLDGSYYAVIDDEQKLIGYYCFGPSAQIPTYDVTYTGDALDIGLGLKPELCGKRMGSDFFIHGLTFAKENIVRNIPSYRLTVAQFNKRAIRVYERNGFIQQKTVIHSRSGSPFVIMTRTV